MIIKYTDILDFHTNDDSVEQLGVGQFLLHSFNVISPIQNFPNFVILFHIARSNQNL